MKVTTYLTEGLDNIIGFSVSMNGSEIGTVVEYESTTGKTIVEIGEENKDIFLNGLKNKIPVGISSHQEDSQESETSAMDYMKEWMNRIQYNKDLWTEIPGIGKFKNLQLKPEPFDLQFDESRSEKAGEVTINLLFDEWKNYESK